MNQFMVNDFVITSKSLLINEEIVSTAAMRAQEESTVPTVGTDATRNNQVWNEELVLTNNEKQSSINQQKQSSRRVRYTASARGVRKQASFTQ